MKTPLVIFLVLLSLFANAQWNVVSTFGNPYTTLAVPSDSNVFYAPVNKYIYYSHDGGANWQFFETEYEYEFFEDMDFVNDSVGFLCGGGWFTPHRNLIMRTIDAGQTWETLTRDSLGLYQFIFNKIDFVTIDSGIVMDGYGYEIFRTIDGGSSWQQIYVDTLNDLRIADIYFVNASLGFLATMGGTSPLSKAKIYKTTDFGTTWQMVQEWDEAHSFNKIHFIDESNGYVGGTDGRLFKTTDGGSTWTAIDVPPGNTITALWFTEPNVGYSNALGTVHKTTDGGYTWIPQLMTPPDVVSDIQFSPSKQTGFLATGSYIYKTTNGGGTTSMLPMPLKAPFNIYPNPASEIIYLEYESKLPIQSIQLTDGSGRLIRKFSNQESAFDISGISAGSYFLNIRTKQGVVCEKVVIR